MPDFGTRIRPDEITPALRDRLIRDARLSEALLQAGVFIGGVAISLLLSLMYRWHGEAWGSEWHPIAFVAFFTVLAIMGVHIWFRWNYQFLKDAPVATAEVEEIDVTDDNKHHLKLRFKGEPGLKTAPEEKVITTDLHTDSPAFNDELHRGDLVSVIYEPNHPEHVQVVEEEHPVGAK